MKYYSKDLEEKVNEYDQKINDAANGEAVQHVIPSRPGKQNEKKQSRV